MAARNKIMVLNAGSSSLKFKLFQMGDGAPDSLKSIASGICERIGDPSASFLRVSSPAWPQVAAASWGGSGGGRRPAGQAATSIRRCRPYQPVLLASMSSA